MAGVKFFYNAMGGGAGAPVLSGTIGSLVALLDAVLVDGFDTKAATSGAIAGGVATLNYSGGVHSAEIGSTILVSGATPGTLNGEQKVTAKSSTSVSFATAEGDGAISGSVSFKMAPLGWTKVFTGTNKRVYKSSDPASTGMFMRVDDTGTTSARVTGYETMSDVDTGTGPFPSTGMIAGGYYWGKASIANATAQQWTLWGDERLFFFHYNPQGSSSYTWGPVFCFGDTISYRSGDPYSCLLTGDLSAAAVTTNGSALSSCCGLAANSTTMQNAVMPRSFSGIGGAIQVLKTGPYCGNGVYSGSLAYSTMGLVYPNGPDFGLILSPIEVSHDKYMRARLPGLLHAPQNIANAFNRHDLVEGNGVYAGRTLLAIRPGIPSTSGTYGVAFADITGPWR